MIKQMPCIICPMSCHLEVTMEGNKIVRVHGNTCPRGEAYARKELVQPMRMVTTTLRIYHASIPLLPVITSKEVPKQHIFDIMKEAKHAVVYAPVRCGDVVLANVAGLGVDLIASRSLDEVNPHESECIASHQGLETV